MLRISHGGFIRCVRIPQAPTAHHRIPRSKFMPDGLIPIAVSHLGKLRFMKCPIRKTTTNEPITTRFANAMCSRHHFVRFLLTVFAAVNGSVIFPIISGCDLHFAGRCAGSTNQVVTLRWIRLSVVSIISPGEHYYLHVHVVSMHPHHTLVEAIAGRLRLKTRRTVN